MRTSAREKGPGAWQRRAGRIGLIASSARGSAPLILVSIPCQIEGSISPNNRGSSR